MEVSAATDRFSSSNSSFGASVTLDPSSGLVKGVGVRGSAGESSGETHIYGAVRAGGTLRAESGRDTDLDGAYIEADRIEMLVGRDLTVRSRQNESWSESSRFNLAGSFDFATYTPSLDSFGLGGSSSERRWTDAMTLILARNDLKAEVKGHTHLTGAAIVSETGDLAFSTGTFGWEDLQDYDRSESWGVDISGIGLSWTPGKGVQGNSGIAGGIASLFADAEQAGKATTGSAFLGEAGFTYSSTDKEGLTHATLGAGTIEVRDTPNPQLASLNRDLATAQEITRDESTEIGINAVFLDLGRLGRQLDNIGNVANAMTTEVPPQVEQYGPGAAEAFRLGLAMGLSAEQAAQQATSPSMLDTIKRGNEFEKAAAFYGGKENIPSKVLDLIRSGATLVYGKDSLWDEPSAVGCSAISSSVCPTSTEDVAVAKERMISALDFQISTVSGSLESLNKKLQSQSDLTITPEEYMALVVAYNAYKDLLETASTGKILEIILNNPDSLYPLLLAANADALGLGANGLLGRPPLPNGNAFASVLAGLRDRLTGWNLRLGMTSTPIGSAGIVGSRDRYALTAALAVAILAERAKQNEKMKELNFSTIDVNDHRVRYLNAPEYNLRAAFMMDEQTGEEILVAETLVSADGKSQIKIHPGAPEDVQKRALYELASAELYAQELFLGGELGPVYILAQQEIKADSPGGNPVVYTIGSSPMEGDDDSGGSGTIVGAPKGGDLPSSGGDVASLPPNGAEQEPDDEDPFGIQQEGDELPDNGINYDEISTAKPDQATAPRDLNEQILWNQVRRNPEAGRPLEQLSGDPRFSRSYGFQKMEAVHKLPDGKKITIHYQYNSRTGKAYDMKFSTPKRAPPSLQPGPTVK